MKPMARKIDCQNTLRTIQRARRDQLRRLPKDRSAAGFGLLLFVVCVAYLYATRH